MYDPQMVQPMRDELTSIGITELLTPEDVDASMKAEGTTLVFVNSVCGCAAGSARPGLRLSQLLKMIQRQDIEGKQPDALARDLSDAFNEHC